MADVTESRSYDNAADEIFELCLNANKALNGEVMEKDMLMGRLKLRIGKRLMNWGTALELEVAPKSSNECQLSIIAYSATAFGTRVLIQNRNETEKYLAAYMKELDTRVERYRLKQGK